MVSLYLQTDYWKRHTDSSRSKPPCANVVVHVVAARPVPGFTHQQTSCTQQKALSVTPFFIIGGTKPTKHGEQPSWQGAGQTEEDTLEMHYEYLSRIHACMTAGDTIQDVHNHVCDDVCSE